MPELNFESICKYVGKLFLESNIQLEAARAQIVKTEQERDEALKLLNKKRAESQWTNLSVSY